MSPPLVGPSVSPSSFRHTAPPEWKPYEALAPIAWWEARDGGLITDLSGNGYTLSGVAPTINLTGSDNSNPIAEFNGTTQYLRRAFTLNQPYYQCVVGAASASDATNRTMVDGASGANTGRIGTIVSGPSSPDRTIFVNAGVTDYPNGTSLAMDTSLIRRFEVFWNGASSDALVTGPDGGTRAGNFGTNNPGGIMVGALGGTTPSAFSDPRIAAIGIFSAPPTGDELTMLRAYLDGL